MHVERRQLSGAREWIDDAPRVSAAVLAELREWAGAEDAAESERKSVRSENLDSALRASTSALRASKKYHGRRPSRVSAAVPGRQISDPKSRLPRHRSSRHRTY